MASQSKIAGPSARSALLTDGNLDKFVAAVKVALQIGVPLVEGEEAVQKYTVKLGRYLVRREFLASCFTC